MTRRLYRTLLFFLKKNLPGKIIKTAKGGLERIFSTELILGSWQVAKCSRALEIGVKGGPFGGWAPPPEKVKNSGSRPPPGTDVLIRAPPEAKRARQNGNPKSPSVRSPKHPRTGKTQNKEAPQIHRDPKEPS